MSGAAIASAAERNKEPILQVLKEILAEKRPGDAPLKALEIASGTGQHVAHFAKALPHIHWQPTDIDARYFPSVGAHIAQEGLINVSEAQRCDITAATEDWPIEVTASVPFDLIYCANMIHISPFETTVGLFSAAGKLLKTPGLLVMYGPFAECGNLEPESNIRFDEGLRAQNPQWGIRDIDDLINIAKENGLLLTKRWDMPANNKTLLFEKQ